MKYIRVLSIDHLDELIRQEHTEFVTCCGILRFSREITHTGNPDRPYRVFSYVDGSTADYSTTDLLQSLPIQQGALWAEI